MAVSIRRTLEPFQRQLWGNLWQTAYGHFRAHRYHLEPNWAAELNRSTSYVRNTHIVPFKLHMDYHSCRKKSWSVCILWHAHSYTLCRKTWPQKMMCSLITTRFSVLDCLFWPCILWILEMRMYSVFPLSRGRRPTENKNTLLYRPSCLPKLPEQRICFAVVL